MLKSGPLPPALTGAVILSMEPQLSQLKMCCMVWSILSASARNHFMLAPHLGQGRSSVYDS